MKLFAGDGTEEGYVLSAMKRLRLRFQRFLRLMTELSFGLNVINGVLILGMLGPAIWLWSKGVGERRRGRRGLGADDPAQRDVGLDHVGDDPAVRACRGDPRGAALGRGAA